MNEYGNATRKQYKTEALKSTGVHCVQWQNIPCCMDVVFKDQQSVTDLQV